MDIREGDRVQVKTRYLEGKGTVVDVAAGELYPVQVWFDEGDEDGHRMHRVSVDEIVPEAPALFSGPDDERLYMGEYIGNSKHLQKGVIYGLGAIQYKGVPQGRCAYVFEGPGKRHKGCYKLSDFRGISDYDLAAFVTDEIVLVPVETEILNISEQLNFFDLFEGSV